MPWAYVATLALPGQVQSLVGAAVSSPAADPPGTLLALWSGGSGGGPLTAFQYDIPAFFQSPTPPVPVTPAPLQGIDSTNDPSAVFWKGAFYLFWRGSGGDASIYCSPLDNPKPFTLVSSATQDAPMVACVPGTDQVFIGYNGPNLSLQNVSFCIVGQLESTPTLTTQPTAVPGASSYYSPGVSATPDGGVSLFFKGDQSDNTLYYTSASQPATGNFSTVTTVDFNGPALATGKPTLATWVPSPPPVHAGATHDSGSPTGGSAPVPVLVAVYPYNNNLWYMEAPYHAAGVTWASQTQIPVSSILGTASPTGGPVTLANPAAVWATSPVASDTVFLLIVDLDAGDTMYLVRYTGPVSPLTAPAG